MLFNLYFLFELFAFLSCAYAYKKLDNNFKIFLPFLAFVVVYEFINLDHIKLLLWHHTNAWSGNFEVMTELIVYGYFIASLDKRKAYRKKVYITIATSIAVTLADIVFIHGFWMLATIGIVVQNMILAVLASNYYYNLIHNLDEYEYPNLISFPPFLAITGLLLYSLVNCFFYTVFDYLVYRKNYHFPIIVRVVQEVSNASLYILLGVAFLCFLRTRKLT